MSLILVDRPWTDQPQEAVAIDWRNPLTRGLVSAGTIINNAPIDLVSGIPLTRSGGAGIGATSRGMAATTASGSSDYWFASLPKLPFASNNKCSVFVLAYSTVSNTTRKRAIRFAHSTTGTIVVIEYSNGVSNRYFGSIQVSGSIFPSVESASTTLTNTIELLCMTRDGTDMKLYLDGIDISSSIVGPSSANFAGDVNQLYLGNNNASFPLNGGVLAWGLWGVALSPRQVAELSSNPWNLFAPSRQPIFYNSASGGLPTLAAITASNITTSGWRATLTAA